MNVLYINITIFSTLTSFRFSHVILQTLENKHWPLNALQFWGVKLFLKITNQFFFQITWTLNEIILAVLKVQELLLGTVEGKKLKKHLIIEHDWMVIENFLSLFLFLFFVALFLLMELQT